MNHGGTINSELAKSLNHDSDVAKNKTTDNYKSPESLAKENSLCRPVELLRGPKSISNHNAAIRQPCLWWMIHTFQVFRRKSTSSYQQVCIVSIENISYWAIIFDSRAFWIHLKRT